MRALLYRWMARKVTVRIGLFADRRTHELRDAAIYLDYARRVALNIASRERAQMYRIGADRTFIPKHFRAEPIIRRQAA